MKKNYKIIIGVIIGIIISTTTIVYAAVTSSGVTYDNSSSGMSSTTVQGAIDELYERSANTNATDSNIVVGYKYSTATATKCITGDESTCVPTTCYKNATSGSCPAGTIIKYRVNANETEVFHVMYDEGSTITMLHRENTTANVQWTTNAYSSSGPTTALTALESATSTWTGVISQTYTLGTTTFKGNGYTLCTAYNSCTSNNYTMASRTARARLISVYEALSLGCGSSTISCPAWVFNYTNATSSMGPTVTKSGVAGYWTLNTFSPSGMHTYAWVISDGGRIQSTSISDTTYGVRAVVKIYKSS